MPQTTDIAAAKKKKVVGAAEPSQGRQAGTIGTSGRQDIGKASTGAVATGGVQERLKVGGAAGTAGAAKTDITKATGAGTTGTTGGTTTTTGTGTQYSAGQNKALQQQIADQRAMTSRIRGAQSDILGAAGVRAADLSEGAANRARISALARGGGGGIAERAAGEQASRAVAQAQAGAATQLLGMEQGAVGAQLAPIMGQQAGQLAQQQLGLQGQQIANQLSLGQGQLALGGQQAANQYALGMGGLAAQRYGINTQAGLTTRQQDISQQQGQGQLQLGQGQLALQQQLALARMRQQQQQGTTGGTTGTAATSGGLRAGITSRGIR